MRVPESRPVFIAFKTAVLFIPQALAAVLNVKVIGQLRVLVSGLPIVARQRLVNRLPVALAAVREPGRRPPINLLATRSNIRLLFNIAAGVELLDVSP